jgi:hypothetical protein
VSACDRCSGTRRGRARVPPFPRPCPLQC